GNVQAWRTRYEARLDQQRGEIAVMQAETQRYGALIQGLTAKIEHQVQRGQAIIAANAAKVQKFSAEAQAASAYNSALGEKIRHLNDANNQNTQLALKNGEINASNALAIIQTTENALQTATQVIAQLAAAMSSNVNMNAGVSD